MIGEDFQKISSRLMGCRQIYKSPMPQVLQNLENLGAGDGGGGFLS